MDVQIGKVTHYYDKIGVAVIDVTNQPLKLGDKVKFSGHDQEFTQTIDSIQIEHKQVSQIDKGDSAGIKVNQQVKPGDAVYLLS